MSASCVRQGCEGEAVGVCAYTDTAGATCGTAWCEAHSHHLADGLYCDRHHAAVLALAASAGSLHQLRRPPVDDRTLSLAQLVFSELNDSMLELLQRWAEPHADATVAGDNHLRAQFLGGRLTWERGWGVSRPQGYLVRVMIRVPVGEPPELIVLVDRNPVFSGTPDWIAARLEDRGGFYTVLLKLVGEAVSRTLSEV